MIEDLDLMNDLIRDRDLNLAFNMSKNSIIDEDVNPKIRFLTFYEFVEVISRIADNASFIPIYIDKKKLWSIF